MKTLASDLWTGLRTGPARAGLALLSLALGLFAVTILLSTLDALRRQARGLVQAFGAETFALVSQSDSGAPWSRRQVDFLRANLGEAAWVSGVRMRPAPAGADWIVAAVDADFFRVRGWQLDSGRTWDEHDARQGARLAVAPADLCRRNRWRAGDVILLGNEPFRLAGTTASASLPVPIIPANAVFIPHASAALETGDDFTRDRVEVILFRARPGHDPDVLRRRVARLLTHPGMAAEGSEWVTPESLLQGIRRWQRAIAWTAGSGGALGLLLGAVTLAGMLLTGVRERVAEIGLRRALGAQPREIAGLFVAEALVLTGAAAVAALVAAELALRGLGGRFPLPFHFGLWTRLGPLALAGALALLCSIGPAWRAARLPPAEALRND
jgi:putative ABC transport system permease protein